MALENLKSMFLKQLVGTARGRAHILTVAADAENNGEGEFFDTLLSKVDDPDLQRMIRRHQADEIEHAALFQACAERQGVRLAPVPDELKLIDRLNRELGGFFDRGIKDRKGVMEAYLLLQVVEERAVTQFALFEPAFRRVDRQSADVFARIAKDEERHLKYCQAIAKRYAPDEFTQARTLRRFRELEARVFADNSRANMQHVLRHDLIDTTPVQKLGWRALAAFAAFAGQAEPTRFLGGDDEHPGRARDTLGPAIAI